MRPSGKLGEQYCPMRLGYRIEGEHCLIRPGGKTGENAIRCDLVVKQMRLGSKTGGGRWPIKSGCKIERKHCPIKPGGKAGERRCLMKPSSKADKT